MAQDVKNEKVEEKVESKDTTTEAPAAAVPSEPKESIFEKLNGYISKIIAIFEPITDKVRKIVLDFGELILTVSVTIGLVSAIIDGLSAMGNVGFFSGLSSMFNNIVSIVMGALVIFLLFAIRKNTEK